ncbi:D-2-hydroxyglutarate dehydrogenase, mitochondrial [Halotydeus destructor]|nr:D-2-hydroxyglutarate dehydrogenase, mitochondrial [Halotydeus destructor]
MFSAFKRALTKYKPYSKCSLIRFGSTYNQVTDQDVKSLQSILGENGVKTEDIDGYNTDWLRSHKGQSNLVILPRKSEEVSSSLKYLSERNIPCVIQSGNTSLVAGPVPVKDEVILSMERMNKIISFDEMSGTLTTEAGCILQGLEEYVQTKGYVMPYDLGAKGSCMIGGNVATNAGGLHFLRYGSLHGTVTGLEVVLANGSVLDLMSSMRKDNTGYDLKQLFIGSEGTLGVITKVGILCPIKPQHKAVAVYGVDSFEKILEVFRYLRQNADEYISAFEMFDRVSLEAVMQNLKLPAPLDEYPFYILTELAASDDVHMMSQLEKISEHLLSSEIVTDGTFTKDIGAMSKLWQYRERIVEALMADGYCYKYDISLPAADFYKVVEEVRRRLSSHGTTRICGYGHVGDSNIHLNITTPSFNKDIKSTMEPWLWEWIRERRGSISAEHGLGMHKRNYIHYAKPPEAIEMMKQVKTLFDPNNILNPMKLLPD